MAIKYSPLWFGLCAIGTLLGSVSTRAEAVGEVPQVYVASTAMETRIPDSGSSVIGVSYDQRLEELERQWAQLQAGPSPAAACGCECNCCCPGWYATADYLNWSVERSDLAFAIRDPGGIGVPAGGQPVMSLDLGPSSGFRTALGRRTASGWQVGVQYTYFRATDNQAFAPGGSQVLAVQSSPATGLTNANSVAASSDFDYDVFDVEAGRWVDMGESLSVLLLGGVRFASIDHRLQARYNGGAFVNGLVDVPTDLDSFGGRLGAAAHWNVLDQWSLFGGSAISVNLADIDARRRETNAGAVVIDAQRSLDQILPALELQLGARGTWGGWSLAAGYEWTNWFNAVSPLEFSDSFHGGTLAPAGRDLGLHGIFVDVAFAY